MEEYDSLTGVKNYYTLVDDEYFAQYEGQVVYVALCDIDNFGMINETYGLNRGDLLLTSVARKIKACFGEAHTFRYGGSDEFVIVNSFYNEDAFLDKLDSLFRQIAAIDTDGKASNITMSVGYVYGNVLSANDLHEAMRVADRRMYEAKRLGKARSAGGPLDESGTGDAGGYEGQTYYKTYEVDELTGLANLVHFRVQLESILKDEKGVGDGDSRLALVYFNIENFKGYNEHFGFDAGDELLLLVSEAIKEAYPGCIAARFSADQFMVATTEGLAVQGIRQVRAAFRARVKDSSIWLKAGVNIVSDDDRNAGLACDRAKLACDDIKGRRDVFYRIYDGALKRQIILRRYVLDHFDEAIENEWIKIYYQPIVRVATGEVCDEEALARWVDPIEGLISPAAFIPVLEDARLIHRLDLYMVRRACENFKKIREVQMEVAPVSINLSRLDFELCDIVNEVESVLAEFDVPPRMVSIEITESALAGNQEFLKSEIDRFRDDGFEVWMDDFGSGYSSLHLLTDYKFDLVKVDMGFLRDFEDNEQTRVMLAHVISMAKELGLKTLVEGVETKEQMEFLKAIGCGRAQGYLLGRPASLRDVEKANSAMEYPDVEATGNHDFYEAIGRVNLMRPDPVGFLDGHYVPGDSAAAIVCRKRGVYEYYNVTAMYRLHLERMGSFSMEEAANKLNDPGTAVYKCFEDVLAHIATVDNRMDSSYSANGNECHLHFRLIAVNPLEDAHALLVIASAED